MLSTRPTHAPPPSRLALGLLLAALAAIPFPSAAAEPLSPLDVASLQSVDDVAVAPDGAEAAYLLTVQREPFVDEDGPAWSELHVVSADGASRPYVTGEENVEAPAWSPDGEAIFFLAKRGDAEHATLWRIPRRGGEAVEVLSFGSEVKEFSLAPDGTRVAFLAVEPPGEEEEELEEQGFDRVVFEEELDPVAVWIARLGSPGDGAGGEAKGEGDASEPRRLLLAGSASELHWSPGGDRLAVAVAPTPLIDDRYMERRVRVVDVDSGGVLARIDNPGKLGDVAWSPDGEHLAVISAADLHDPSEGRLMVAPAAGGELRDLLPGLEGQVEAFAWAEDDEIVYAASIGVESMVGRVGLDGGAASAVTVVGTGGPIWEDLGIGAGGAAFLVGNTPDHPSEVFRVDALAADAAPRRLTDSNPWLAERALAPQEAVTWAARDGLDLQGVLMRPLGAGEGERHPLIVVVHGGPESHEPNGWRTSYSRPGQVAAGRGFAVFYPNYRGSTGRGVEFSKLSQGDPAGAEFDDIVDGVDHLIATGLVDGERVGITGGSYGGYATAWGSTYYSERFAAGVMFVGISEQISKIGTSDIPRELHLVHLRQWPWDDWQFLLERSPVYYLDRHETPLLILHGEEDTRVFPGQSLELHRYLKLRDQAPVRLVLYPGEGHGNRRAASRLDYNLRMLRWFEHYLQGEGGEPPPPAVEYPLPAGAEEAGE